MNPRARSEGLLIQVVGTDTLVYDRKDQASCCLNAIASAVWRHCDGSHSVAEIAELVAREVTLPEGAAPVAIVWSSLEELRSNGLLLEAKDDAREAAAWTVGRRQMLKASAAAVALPSVDKIFAPSMASASSPVPTASSSSSMPATTQSATGTTPFLTTQTQTRTSTPTRSNTPSRSPSA